MPFRNLGAINSAVHRIRMHASDAFASRTLSDGNKENYDLRHKLQEMGRQIQTLTALFEDLQHHFEYEERAQFEQGATSQISFDSPQRLMVSVPTPATLRTHAGDGVGPHQHEELFSAIQTHRVEDVQELLLQGGDPNAQWTNIDFLQKKYVSITPLAMAGLQQNIDMVHMLVENKASLESEYSFIAGAEQKVWKGSVIHACIPSGNLNLLRNLADMRADIHTAGSNGANLVWQASYFGQLSILKFLLDRGVSVKCSALSPDSSDLAYSPLHVATIKGYGSIVSSLLEVQADVLEDDGQGRMPLDDAVRHGHASIVKQLITKNADLFGTTSLSLSSHTLMTQIFDSQNSVLISKVAKALGARVRIPGRPEMLDLLNEQDLLGFLNAPGTAPVDALEAIFQPYHLWYWEADNGRLERKQGTSAFIDMVQGWNIMEGPHHSKMKSRFNKKQPLDAESLSFVNHLLPRERPLEWGSMFVPTTTYMCHIPMVHKDLRVLLALADCPNIQIFNTPGCGAIITWKWMSERSLARFRMVIAFIEVANFMAINFIIDETQSMFLLDSEVALELANALSVIIWIVAMFMEMVQMLGFISNGLTRRYFAAFRHWFDILVLLITGSVSIVLLRLGEAAVRDSIFCTTLGMLIFMKWLRFLIYLRQIKAIGMEILPIMQTMWDIGPFLVVLGIYLLATVNMFYALDNGYSFSECFVLIYRLVVLGDANVYELENQAAPQMAVDLATGSVTQSAPPATDNFIIVRVIMVFGTFVGGVSLLNVFLAMLCLSYSLAHDQANLSFMRSRSKMVLDQHALRVGMTRLCCCFQTPTETMISGCEDSDIRAPTPESLRTSEMLNSRNSSTHKFLWIAKQAQDDEDLP